MNLERVEIKESPSPKLGATTKEITALDSNGAPIGHVTAEVLLLNGRARHVTISELEVNTLGQGLGPQLLLKLKDQIGPGVEMSSAIDHEASDTKLENDGWYHKAENHPQVTIAQSNYLHRLPIVRVYERGGFIIEKIGFEKSPDGELFATLYGKTSD